MSAPVSIRYATRRPYAPAPATLRRWVGAARGRAPGEVALRIVGRREGRALNRRWRQRDHATNVLSFPLAEGPRPALLGDLVICAPVLADEARAQGKPLRAHWAHIVVHGVLHLLGHDHRRPRDAARMERRERAVLAALGYPDPYGCQA